MGFRAIYLVDALAFLLVGVAVLRGRAETAPAPPAADAGPEGTGAG